MQVAKKIKIISLTILITPVFILLWISEISPKARKAKQNVRNSLLLENGMSTNEMLNIMGEPDNIRYRLDNHFQDSVYFYQPPFASSAGIDIIIKHDTINRIILYE